MQATSLETGLSKAIQAAGGQSALCRLIGIKNHQVVQHWRKTRIPAEWCQRIESATGVPRSELRPDLFADLTPSIVGKNPAV